MGRLESNKYLKITSNTVSEVTLPCYFGADFVDNWIQTEPESFVVIRPFIRQLKTKVSISLLHKSVEVD